MSAETREELQQQIDDLRALERDYRSRLRAHLCEKLMELDPDIAFVSREDLREAVTVIALHAPPEFRPAGLLERLGAIARGDVW